MDTYTSLAQVIELVAHAMSRTIEIRGLRKIVQKTKSGDRIIRVNEKLLTFSTVAKPSITFHPTEHTKIGCLGCVLVDWPPPSWSHDMCVKQAQMKRKLFTKRGQRKATR